MKTMFTLGFPGTVDYWSPGLGGGAPLLGQLGSIPSGTLSEDQRNSVVGQLKDSIAKAQQIDTWVRAVGDGQKGILGDNYAAFRGYVDYAYELAGDVAPINDRLNDSNIEEWWIADEDVWKIESFMKAVDQAYNIYGMTQKRETPPRTPVSPGGTMIPTLLTTAPGAAAAALKPGAAPAGLTPARPASSGIMPQSKILGVPTNDFLIGGGVVIGLGILAYSLL